MQGLFICLSSDLHIIPGFAFVYFEDERDAEDAIRGIDNLPFGYEKRRLSVEWAKGERGRHKDGSKSVENRRPTKTLFVINFDPIRTRDRDIERHFEPYGKVLNVRIRRNFAFVQFQTQEDATKALECTHMSKLLDRVVSVEYALRDDDELDVLGDDDFDAVPDSEAYELLKARQGQDKRGTTIVCIVGNGFFVIGADSYTHIDGELDELDKMKLHYICDGVVAAHAGYVHEGEIILKTVREQCEVVPPSSLEEVVSWTIKYANVCNDLRKVNPTYAFKGSAFIVGGKIPNSTNKMEAFLVFNDDGEGYRCFRSSSHLCDGSDSGSARMYIEVNIHSITRERDDRMAIARHVVKALDLAVMLSEGSTGGDLNIVITSEDGVREMYTVKQKEDGSYGDLVASDHQLEGLKCSN